MKKRLIFHPLLFALYPALELYFNLSPEVEFSQTWRALPLLMALTALLWYALRRRYHDAQRAALVTTALVASGLAVDEFSFLGFLPNKSAARKKRLARFAEREETLIFFESPFRLPSALRDMFEVFGDREAVVARELTKKFEELLRGRLSELVRDVEKRPRKGEMVVLVSGQGRKKLLS